MIKWDDVGVGKPYPPKSEASRIHAIEQNRELYEGNFRSLNLTERNAVERGGAIYDANGRVLRGLIRNFEQVSNNLFRRVATIYPDFLFSEQVLPTTGNARLDQFLRAIDNLLTKVLWAMNVDSLRFGVSVLTTGEGQVGLRVIEPDRWFPVVDAAGRLIGDVTAEHVVGTHSATYEADRFNVVRMQMNDYRENVRTTNAFEFDAGTLGVSLEGRQERITEGVRQVAVLYHGYSTQPDRGQSAYTDLKPVIRSMIESSTAQSGALLTNSQPYIVGPAMALLNPSLGGSEMPAGLKLMGSDRQHRDDLTTSRYFGLQGDGKADQIKYLQYETNAEGYKAERERNLQDFYTLSGLSPLLFQTTAARGDVSGAALRRLLIPFVTRLERIRRSNDELFGSIITLLNAANAVTGAEVYSFDPGALEVDWGYQSIFTDEVSTETAAGGSEQDEQEGE